MGKRELTIDMIESVTGGRLVGDSALKSRVVRGAVRDNRDVAEGNLFVCFRGERVDGHDFANRAFDAGAACCLAEREIPDAAGPYILVKSTAEALKRLGGYYRSLFDIPVIGVTGSVGKTTAKEMICAVLSARLNVLKTPENLNNEIGVPLTLLSLEDSHEAAVIEMGISEFGEMRRLAEMVRPDICLITKIGHCHLEALGDLEGVLRAKSEVFELMSADATAIVNGDDELLRAADLKIKKLTFGTQPGNDYRAMNIVSASKSSVSCDLVFPDAKISAEIPAYGSHLVYAALPAAVIARLLGLSFDEIRSGIAAFSPVGSRSRIIETGQITIIDDCYNANPNSVKASILSLSGLKGRRVAILGDMKELGWQADTLHREVGVCVAESGIDCLICCGAKAEYIFKGLKSTGSEIEAYHFPLKDALLSTLHTIVRPGDSVLVKASHSMNFDDITETLVKLD